MVINSTNINKTINHLSPQIIERFFFKSIAMWVISCIKSLLLVFHLLMSESKLHLPCKMTVGTLLYSMHLDQNSTVSQFTLK